MINIITLTAMILEYYLLHQPFSHEKVKKQLTITTCIKSLELQQYNLKWLCIWVTSVGENDTYSGNSLHLTGLAMASGKINQSGNKIGSACVN